MQRNCTVITIVPTWFWYHLFPDETWIHWAYLSTCKRYVDNPVDGTVNKWWYYLSILWPRRPHLVWVVGGPRFSGACHALLGGAGEKPKIKALKMFKWRLILFSLGHVWDWSCSFSGWRFLQLSELANPVFEIQRWASLFNWKWCIFKWDPLIVAANCLVFLW